MITDIFMPTQDGLETIRRLRAEYPNVKLLVVSGGGQRIKAAGYLLPAVFTAYLLYGFIRPRISRRIRHEIEEEDDA